jgi:hypothetical protein
MKRAATFNSDSSGLIVSFVSLDLFNEIADPFSSILKADPVTDPAI